MKACIRCEKPTNEVVEQHRLACCGKTIRICARCAVGLTLLSPREFLVMWATDIHTCERSADGQAH